MLYPNPFNDKLHIDFNITTSGNYSFEIFHILGKRINIANGVMLDEGTYSVIIESQELNNLTEGIVVFTLIYEENIICSMKIIKQ